MPTKKTRQLRFIDAFAGCGGLSLGLCQAGFTGVLAIEKNDCAFESLKVNLLESAERCWFEWPDWLPQEAIGIEQLLSKHSANLANLSGQIDLLAGGPPCQGFSSAGRRDADDPRNLLFKSYLRLVSVIKPKAVLIENVRGFTLDFDRDNRANYSSLMIEALEQDYTVHDALINVSIFGVPQNRTRYFLLAFRKDIAVVDPFGELIGSLPSFLRELGLSTPVSCWAAISDLEVSRCGSRASLESRGFKEVAYVGPLTSYQNLMAYLPEGPGDLRLANHSDTIIKRFSRIIEACREEGRLNKNLSSELRDRFGLKKLALRVLDPDQPSPTITSLPDDLLHYKEPRILTVRETARLQSFPDWFVFRGKYTTGGKRRRYEVPRYTQVANAVPPLASRALGELVSAILRKQEPATRLVKRPPTLEIGASPL